MHKAITVNGQEYELQISARRLESNDKWVLMDEPEVYAMVDELESAVEKYVSDFRFWFKYHSKNLTKKQEYKIDELYNGVMNMLLAGVFGNAEEGEN